MAGPREGLQPWESSGNDAYDRLTGKGIYFVQSAPVPSPGGGTASPPPPPPKPHNPWITTSDYSEPVGVKQADPDIVLFDTESISPELLLQLEYEAVSGTELINISRADIIDGREVIYSPIKNLSGLRRKFNPNNIIAMPSTSSSLFSKYPIDLINRVPYEPYFNENGDLVIEIEDIREDEVIEVEVDSSGTINTVDFS